MKLKAFDIETVTQGIPRGALNPLFGRVCAYSFVCDDEEVGVIEDLTDEAERELLKKIFKHFVVGDISVQIISWNGNGFDFPFIFKRAAILGVSPGSVLSYWTNRYKTMPHADLMSVWAAGGKFETLAAVAKAFGYEKMESDFEAFPEYIKNKQHEKISEYCLNDSRIVYELGNRFVNVIL